MQAKSEIKLRKNLTHLVFCCGNMLYERYLVAGVK